MIKHSNLLPAALLALCYSFATTTVSADEGMWQPHNPISYLKLQSSSKPPV